LTLDQSNSWCAPGAGYNTIDVSAASKRGIYVSNCPGKNSIAVAELAFALILALDRRIADNVVTLASRRME
jgi:D-3-phosphoglycerate dehydrogenase